MYVEFLLWLNELSTNEKYESLLHRYFINALNDKVLLELEECSSDIRKTNAILKKYWDSAHMILDVDALGDHLLTELESIYKYNKYGIEEFGKRCYSLWNHFHHTYNGKNLFGPWVMPMIACLGMTKRKLASYMRRRSPFIVRKNKLHTTFYCFCLHLHTFLLFFHI